MGNETPSRLDDHGYKVIFMHGFSQEELTRIMRGVKSVVTDPGMVAFCMSTENNLDLKIRELIADVTEEHDYLKRTSKNPPFDSSY